jgi:hypothetical protein
MRPRAVGTEPGEDVARWQRRERAQRADAEPAQQVDQRRRAGRVERLDRQVLQEGGGAAGADDDTAPGRLLGGERAVGDADQQVGARFRGELATRACYSRDSSNCS